MTITNKRSELSVISAKQGKASLKAPPLPKSLPKEMRREWAGLVRHLRERSMWTDQKAGVAESYLINLHAIRLAQRALADNGEDIMAGKVSETIARHTGQLAKLASLLGLGAEKVLAPPVKDEKKKVWSA